jgi:putative ABC transport system permease protein
LDTIWQDIRYSLRILLKNPGFTGIVVIALAIGIGANSAIFSVVNSVLLRPLRYDDPSRLVMVWMDNTRMHVEQDIHSYPNYVDYRDRNESFDDLAAYYGISVNFVGSGEPERVIGTRASANLFGILGVSPYTGRSFLPEEDEPGKDKVVVIGYDLWQRRFGGDTSVIGQAVTMSDVPRTIVGVMPPGFRFPSKDAEFWVPLAPEQEEKEARGAFGYWVIGRLKPGVTLEHARVDMSAIAASLVQQYPQIMEGFGVNLVPLHEQVVGKVRPMLLILLGAVGFVLLIACANVANLLLARALMREREIAIRTALGAGRRRLIRQLLTESAVLALLGGAAGLLLAKWGVSLLIALSPSDTPRLDQITIDGRVLAFTLIVALLTALIFGIVPALQASKPDLNESLKEGSRGSTGARTHRIRNALVVSEIAISAVLLVGAGLMIRSFARLQQLDLGFKPDHLLTMNLQLTRARSQEGKGVVFYRDLIERVGALPGVESAGAITAIFLEELPNSTNFSIEGRPPLPPSEQIETPIDFVTPGFFKAMGAPLLRGRELSEADKPDTPRVALINDTFARQFWPGEDPIGQRFKFGRPDSNSPWMTIVGVVADMRRTGYEAAVRCETFLPYTQRPNIGFMSLVVRTTGDPSSMIATVRDQIRQIDREQPISHAGPMTELLGEMIARRRFGTLLLSFFAAVAALLAFVGVYGVVSQSITQREHEIGIRMALGARTSDVLKLVLRQGVSMVIPGVVAGLTGAWWLTSLMTGLLYQTGTHDSFTFIATGAMLAMVAIVATAIPARRAARVDPMVALRQE